MLSNCGVGEDFWEFPQTARISKQSILKECSPEYSLEILMLKLKLQYFGHLMWRTDSLEKRPWAGTTNLSHFQILKLQKLSSVQSLSRVRLFVTPWTGAGQASLSITYSQSLLIFMSIELMMPSNHLILCCPLLLLPSVFPSIGVFSNESAFRIRWPKYWSFSFNISPSNEHSGVISFRMDW